MRSNRMPVVTLLFALAVSGCSAALYMPDERDAVHGVTVDDLRRGREVYVGRCGSCHSLRLPEQHTMLEWDRYLQEMGPRAMVTRGDSLAIRRFLDAGRRRVQPE